MRKLALLALIATAAVTAIGTWAAGNSRGRDRAVASFTTPISPLELMKIAPASLPHEQYDAF